MIFFFVSDIEQIALVSGRFSELEDSFSKATDEKELQNISASIGEVANGVTTLGLAIKQKLVKLNEENDRFQSEFHDAKNSASLEMRRKLYDRNARNFKAAMDTFGVAHQNCLTAWRQQQTRRLHNIDTEHQLDAKMIDRIIDNGQVDAVILSAFIGSSDLRDCLADIEQRHTDVLKLEREVQQIYELFKDVAVLVDIQEDSLQVISEHISKAKSYAERGEQHLKKAEEHQKCSRKVSIRTSGYLSHSYVCECFIDVLLHLVHIGDTCSCDCHFHIHPQKIVIKKYHCR